MEDFALFDIEKLEENKFSIEYFLDTRGSIRLEEAINVLHIYKKEKTIENIIIVDKLNQELLKIFFLYLGLFEDHLKREIELSNSKLSYNEIKNYGLKRLLLIYIDEDYKKIENVILIDKFKNKIVRHQNIIDKESIEEMKMFIETLPFKLKENLIKDIKEILIKYDLLFFIKK